MLTWPWRIGKTKQQSFPRHVPSISDTKLPNKETATLNGVNSIAYPLKINPVITFYRIASFQCILNVMTHELLKVLNTWMYWPKTENKEQKALTSPFLWKISPDLYKLWTVYYRETCWPCICLFFHSIYNPQNMWHLNSYTFPTLLHRFLLCSMYIFYFISMNMYKFHPLNIGKMGHLIGWLGIEPLTHWLVSQNTLPIHWPDVELNNPDSGHYKKWALKSVYTLSILYAILGHE